MASPAQPIPCSRQIAFTRFITRLGGIARVANGLWMAQVARNLTDGVDGFFKGKRYLIHDRDPLYTRDFLNMLLTLALNP